METPAADPLPRIADILWPNSESEQSLRARLGGLTGVDPARAAWELFALRDHALDVMYSLIYDGRNVPPDMTTSIFKVLEPRWATAPAPANVEEWRASRDALYTGVMPGGEDARPYPEIWKDWIERVGGCFASAFDAPENGAGQIGTLEYDKAAKQLFPLCKQLPDRWR